jgi:hypothetical protein
LKDRNPWHQEHIETYVKNCKMTDDNDEQDEEETITSENSNDSETKDTEETEEIAAETDLRPPVPLFELNITYTRYQTMYINIQNLRYNK